MKYYIHDIDWDFVQEEVEFLNHLVLTNKSLSINFFEKIGGKYTIEKYKEFFNNRQIIFLPKKINNISFVDKIHLRNPKKWLPFQQDFKKYCELIEIKKATVEELDSVLTPYFKATTPFVKDKIIIFDVKKERCNRYTQFKYLIEGIGNKKIQWFNYSTKPAEEALVWQLNQELKNLGSKEMKDIAFWYYAGTSAVSPN